MDLNAYHFMSRWAIGAPPDAVYAALHEVVDYPRWWPQVREAERLDDDRSRLRTRSFLPYDIGFVLEREIADPVGRILQARLQGDIDGTIRWSIAAAGAGSLAIWDQRVIARKPLLRRFAPVARPFFRANHAVMMSAGERGLARLLAPTTDDAARADSEVRPTPPD